MNGACRAAASSPRLSRAVGESRRVVGGMFGRLTSRVSLTRSQGGEGSVRSFEGRHRMDRSGGKKTKRPPGRVLFVSSPEGVRNLWALPEAEASVLRAAGARSAGRPTLNILMRRAAPRW